MRLTTTVIAGLLLVSVAGCAGESAPEPSEAAQATCDLLSADDLTALAGQDLGEPEAGDAAGLPTCRWGSPAEVGVQVVDVPVTEWVAELGPVLDELEQELDDPANAARIEEARRLLESGDLDDTTGCEAFSLFAEIQGLGADLARTVNVIPSKEQPEAISAQACGGGRYTSVLLQGPVVTGSDAQVEQVDAALDAAIAGSG